MMMMTMMMIMMVMMKDGEEIKSDEEGRDKNNR